MGIERVRWSDDRLDDRFETLTSEVRTYRNLPKIVAEHEIEIRNISEDINGLGNKIQEFIDDQKAAERDRIRERKSDRRWLVGTVLTSAGLVIAALGLLLDKF